MHHLTCQHAVFMYYAELVHRWAMFAIVCKIIILIINLSELLVVTVDANTSFPNLSHQSVSYIIWNITING